MNYQELLQSKTQKEQEIASIKNQLNNIKVTIPEMSDDEKYDIEEKQSRAAAEALMGYDPNMANEWLNKAETIKNNRTQRSQQLSDKADAQAQSQKNDALTELANIDQNAPEATTEWTSIRNKWITKNPKLEAYLPATPSFIDAKGNFGKLAERGYADQLMKQAQSEKYLANSSTTTTERAQHIANAKVYEERAKQYGAQVAESKVTGNDAFDKFMEGYDAKTKIPDALKSKWTAPEQKIINDHNNQVDADENQALDLAKGYEGLSADKFKNAVDETLGTSVEAAQKELEALKRGAVSVQAAVKNNNTKGAAYMAMKKSLGDALSGSDFSGMAGFGIGEGIIGKLNEMVGSAQITDEKAKSLVKSFVDGLNETITLYNSNVTTKTEKSPLKEKIRSKFTVTPVKSVELGGTFIPTPDGNAGQTTRAPSGAVKQLAKELQLTDLVFVGGKWRGTDKSGVLREVK